MAAASIRLLSLLGLLQSRRYWRGEELADRLEVSSRTLRRDVERLRELGYPIEARRGVDGGYQLASGAALPPLVLDDEEAIALGVGLQAALQGGTVSGIAEASARALAKILKVMPAPLRRRLDALAEMTVPAAWGEKAPSVDPNVLSSLALSCRDGERVTFSYTGRDAVAGERRADPHRLVLLGRRWYLVAFDLDRFDWRSFRVDRLSGPRTTGERVVPRELPAEDAASFVRTSIENLERERVVLAVVSCPGPVARERVGSWASVEDLDATSCAVRISSDGLAWPVMVLGMLGADFELKGPPEAADELARVSARLARGAGPGGAEAPYR